MAEKGIRTNSHSDISNLQTINQLSKKQTGPDGGEGDKYQLIPTFPTGKLSINSMKNKQHLMAKKGIRTNSSRHSAIGKLSIN
jgi:hypothetical protein